MLYRGITQQIRAIQKMPLCVTPNGAARLFLVKQPLGVPGVYHVALYGVAEEGHHFFERVPAQGDFWHMKPECTEAYVYWLPPAHRTLNELIQYESTLPAVYTLGTRDCRHHVEDLLRWAYPYTLS